MKLGIASPSSLRPLAKFVRGGENLPEGYRFAPMACWIEELIKRDYQVSLFTLAPQVSTPITFHGDRLTIHIGRYRSRHRARDFFKLEQSDLLYAMRNDPVEIIHANWTYEFALAALKTGTPVLVTAHDAPLEILKLNRNPYHLLRCLMAKQVCQLAPIMTVVSSYLEKHFREVFGYRKPIHLIPNGIPEFVFSLPDDSKKNTNKSRVIFASNLTGWSERKNGGTLIKAFSGVLSHNPDHELWMFGNGYGDGEEAHKWAELNKMNKNIKFFGYVPYTKLLNTLAQYVDILVHPALEESFSMAIAEAMALRLPVIAGKNSGAVPDTLQSGGLLVDVKSKKEITAAMIQLAGNPQLRETLGENGFAIANNRYHIELVNHQYQRLYRQLT